MHMKYKFGLNGNRLSYDLVRYVSQHVHCIADYDNTYKATGYILMNQLRLYNFKQADTLTCRPTLCRIFFTFQFIHL